MWPGRALQRRARRYRSLATALEAGLPVREALALARDESPKQAGWEERVASHVDRGGTLAEALERETAATWEIRAIAASEGAGLLPEVLSELAEHLEARASVVNRLAWRLAYPALLLHAAVLLPQLRWLVLGGLRAYLAHVVPALALIYLLAGAAALVIAWGRRRLRTSAAFARLVRGLPVVGPLLRKSAARTYAFLLSLLVSSGVPMADALTQAAQALSHGEVRRSALRIRQSVVARGRDLASAFAAEARVWPPLLVSAVRTGEAAGRLDEVLRSTAQALGREVEKTTERVMMVIPAMIYLGAAIYVAYVVISTYVGLYSRLPV